MTAKIFRPAKTAMQSGKAKTHLWVLEFDQEEPRSIDVIGQRVDARKASTQGGQHGVRRIGSGAGGDAGIGLGHP